MEVTTLTIKKLKKIPLDEAEEKVRKYINKHQGCRTRDIIFDLELDPDLVLEVLQKLESKGNIRGEEIKWSR